MGMFGSTSKAEVAAKSAAVDEALDRQAINRAQRKLDAAAATRRHYEAVISATACAPRAREASDEPAPRRLRVVRD